MASAEAKEKAPAKGSSKGPLILALVNTLAVLAAMGFMAYSKLIFKRPVITEESERARIAAEQAKPKAPVIPGTVTFEPFTVNISPTPGQAKPADGTTEQIQGKLHYATVGFALEITDIARKSELETVRPIIMDRLLAALGRKAYHELTTVQGRYIVRTQIIELVNEALRKAGGAPTAGPDLVTNVYFTQFVVQ